jgi:hypothetical protein
VKSDNEKNGGNMIQKDDAEAVGGLAAEIAEQPPFFPSSLISSTLDLNNTLRIPKFH